MGWLWNKVKDFNVHMNEETSFLGPDPHPAYALGALALLGSAFISPVIPAAILGAGAVKLTQEATCGAAKKMLTKGESTPKPPRVVYRDRPLPTPTREDCLKAEEAEHNRKLEIAEKITDTDLREAMVDYENERHDFVLTQLVKEC